MNTVFYTDPKFWIIWFIGFVLCELMLIFYVRPRYNKPNDEMFKIGIGTFGSILWPISIAFTLVVIVPLALILIVKNIIKFFKWLVPKRIK